MGKSYATLLRGWLWDSGYPIWYNLPLFATVCHYSHYSRLLAPFVLFGIRVYSLFAIRDYSLFGIRVFQKPFLSNPCPHSAWNRESGVVSSDPSHVSPADYCSTVAWMKLLHDTVVWMVQGVVRGMKISSAFEASGLSSSRLRPVSVAQSNQEYFYSLRWYTDTCQLYGYPQH